MMLGRAWGSGDSHRYGFNGKEQDPETYGNGNSYDYGFRIYNPGISKFLSVDPLYSKFPMLTPYQFASLTPIRAIDLDGLEGVIVVHVINTPKDFDREMFAAELQARLIENGANPGTRVVYEEDYTYLQRTKDFITGKYKRNQSADLKIKDFTLGQDHYEAGGYSKLGSHSAVLYTGLHPAGDKERAPLPTTIYVNAALHELGHAIYSFDHDEKGNTNSGEGLMDYDHVFDTDAKFDRVQREVITLIGNGEDPLIDESDRQ